MNWMCNYTFVCIGIYKVILILLSSITILRYIYDFNLEAGERPPGAPDAVCVSYTHDRDFGHFKEYPKGKEQYRGRGWCPRRGREYPGEHVDMLLACFEPGFQPDCARLRALRGSKNLA